MDRVHVVLANNDRVTLRVADTFLKVDADQARTDVEVEAMTLAPVPTPQILWRQPPVLALAALAGQPISRLGEPSTASPGAWTATGAALRDLHDAPLPPRPAPTLDELTSRLSTECDWLTANDILPTEVIAPNRRLAEAAVQPSTPVFVHGDLHTEHVFVDGDQLTGILDWSEARHGDRHYDLATLTLGHPEHLDDVLAGYGTDVDHERIRGWRSWRCLVAIRWLHDNGYGPPDQFPETAILLAQA